MPAKRKSPPDEFDPSQPLEKHLEDFVLLLFKGRNPSQAYRELHPAAVDETVWPRACHLRNDSKVVARLALLNSQKAQAIVKEFAWQEVDALKWALTVIETPIGQVDEHHPLAQEVTTTDTEYGQTKKVKMPAKMDAFGKIIQVMGWDKGTVAENKTADSFRTAAAEIVSRLTHGKPAK